jgi:hypothetical protein
VSGCRVMKVQCKPNSQAKRNAARRDLCIISRLWAKTLPFNVNPNGWLIHRVRYGESHYYRGKFSHDSVTYWCGGQNSGSGINLTDKHPKDRLLCVGCERKAVAAGEHPADKLAGRHIHLGELRPHRLCCRNEEN